MRDYFASGGATEYVAILILNVGVDDMPEPRPPPFRVGASPHFSPVKAACDVHFLVVIGKGCRLHHSGTRLEADQRTRCDQQLFLEDVAHFQESLLVHPSPLSRFHRFVLGGKRQGIAGERVACRAEENSAGFGFFRPSVDVAIVFDVRQQAAVVVLDSRQLLQEVVDERRNLSVVDRSEQSHVFLVVFLKVLVLRVEAEACLVEMQSEARFEIRQLVYGERPLAEHVLMVRKVGRAFGQVDLQQVTGHFRLEVLVRRELVAQPVHFFGPEKLGKASAGVQAVVLLHPVEKLLRCEEMPAVFRVD
mmetsp:Transcript_31254/g.54954  ORF Transcript_31254/g.54954 Transcript_31254/m.54954 type:complete len:305 (+) Transcript_31254:1568-2482(+)